MKLPLDERFVQWAIDAVGHETLVHALKDEIKRRRGDQSQKDFFSALASDPHSARGYWQRGVSSTDDQVRDVSALTEFIGLLQPHIDIDTRSRPWNTWQAGSEVAIVLGVRTVEISEVSTSVKQRGIGARDTEALGRMTSLCYRELGLDCTVATEHARSNLDGAAAESMLDDIRSRKGVGMVCIIGSPVVNPLANVAAKQILTEEDGRIISPPAMFRWGYEPDDWLLADRPPERINGDWKWPPNAEGIGFPNIPDTHFPRIPDDVVLDQIGDQKVFKDCGLLLMDVRSRPYIVVCAGHGGCGSLGCVTVLRDRATIAELVSASEDEHAITGRGRVFAVVEVERELGPEMALEDEPVDDLKISKPPRIAWASVEIASKEWD